MDFVARDFFEKFSKMTEKIKNILQNILNPFTQTPFQFQNIEITPSSISLEVLLPYPAQSQFEALRQTLCTPLLKEYREENIHIAFLTHIITHKIKNNLKPLPGIKNMLAVASGKGGVGKSTVATNLALALQKEGAQAGILDADLYGPSQPLILGLKNQVPEMFPDQTMRPLENYGVKVMSVGFLIQTEDTPMIWRGPMLSSILEKMLTQTHWGELDYLIVDLPPGTGDAQLTLAQKTPLTAALIVTTPQDVALIDAQKAFKMFEKTNIPVLGVVENMSSFLCPHCQTETPIFGKGGAEKMQALYQMDILGKVPLSLSIREKTDEGKPTVMSAPNSKEAAIYQDIAFKIALKIAQMPKDFSARMPKIVVENG